MEFPHLHRVASVNKTLLCCFSNNWFKCAFTWKKLSPLRLFTMWLLLIAKYDIPVIKNHIISYILDFSLSARRSWSTQWKAVWTRLSVALSGPVGACLCWRATGLYYGLTWRVWREKWPCCLEEGQGTNRHTAVGCFYVSGLKRRVSVDYHCFISPSLRSLLCVVRLCWCRNVVGSCSRWSICISTSCQYPGCNSLLAQCRWYLRGFCLFCDIFHGY